MKIERTEYWAWGCMFSREVGAIVVGRWALVLWKPDYLL